MTNDPIVIAGFHRSGTSAVARALHLAGVFLGDELLRARPSNPYGHFEDVEVVHLHRDLLQINGTSWLCHEPFEPIVPDEVWTRMTDFVRRRQALGAPWGFKDPRVCLFLPLWHHVLPELRVVMVYRTPAEAVRSLHSRHARQLVIREGVPALHESFWRVDDLGLRMWLHYHRTLLDTLPDPSRYHVVPFADRHAVAELVPTANRLWGYDLDEADHSAIDPDLGRAEVLPLRVVDHSLIDEVSAMWDRLEALAADSAARAAWLEPASG